ncbi:nucleotide-binding domain-containing protein, partial [Terfezia boudieri ATCC MYA-4762]
RAGVVGLQTALSLLEAGYGVIVVAKYWPGDKSIDYTSPWAGAHWRPHAAVDELELQKYEMATFRYWTEMVKKVPKEECGVTILPDTYFWDSGNPETISALWWPNLIPNIRMIPESDLIPGTTLGMMYHSFCIDVPMYLDYLVGKLGDLGVKTITAEVDTLEDVFELPGIEDDVVVGMVNCTGMGALNLVPDEKVYPMKGQTVIVKGRAKQITFRKGEGYVAYVVPRIGEEITVLGGTQGVRDWDPEPNSAVTEEILKRCKAIAPELLNEKGEFEIIAVQAGRRPSREGGPRVALVKHAGGKFICHNYGHGGAGYQSSFGSAMEVVSLVNGFLGRK